jgi:hypothetical protein
VWRATPGSIGCFWATRITSSPDFLVLVRDSRNIVECLLRWEHKMRACRLFSAMDLLWENCTHSTLAPKGHTSCSVDERRGPAFAATMVGVGIPADKAPKLGLVGAHDREAIWVPPKGITARFCTRAV